MIVACRIINNVLLKRLLNSSLAHGRGIVCGNTDLLYYFLCFTLYSTNHNLPSICLIFLIK